jgi:hypothetical protein
VIYPVIPAILTQYCHPVANFDFMFLFQGGWIDFRGTI